MPSKIWTIVASVVAVALAVIFLGQLAIHIGELPLLVIVFGVMAMMLWDYVDTTRTNIRASAASNGDNGASGGSAASS